jgi:hypothetical protein
MYKNNKLNQFVPVFTPTYEEFKDFNTYVQSIEPQIKNIGICKIKPPKEWR